MILARAEQAVVRCTWSLTLPACAAVWDAKPCKQAPFAQRGVQPQYFQKLGIYAFTCSSDPNMGKQAMTEHWLRCTASCWCIVQQPIHQGHEMQHTPQHSCAYGLEPRLFAHLHRQHQPFVTCLGQSWQFRDFPGQLIKSVQGLVQLCGTQDLVFYRIYGA